MNRSPIPTIRGNILIVDDVHENLRILTEVFAARDHVVRPVSNGQQALRSVEEERPDVILLDIKMPDISGYEMCTLVKANPNTREIPVIFISSLNEVFDKVHAFESGAVDYITKPFQVEEVIARVETHLTLRKVQQELQANNRRLQEEIRERQRTEEQLRKLSRAVEQSANEIIITDLQGQIEFVNPAFSFTTGYSPEEVIGRNSRLLQSGHHSPEFYRTLWETITQGNVWQGEFLNKKKNGERYWESASISPVKDARGQITHYLAVKHDITERKQNEDALKQLNRQLQEANLSKDKFFSIIAHDLRNPLTGLLVTTEAIISYLEESRESEIIALMRELKTSTETVYALLENLLSWARLQQGMMEYMPRDIILDQMIDHNFNLFTAVAKHKGLGFKRVVWGTPIAYADYHMVNTVLRNLLSNALKFTHPGGTIEVSIRDDRSMVEVAVSDTGIGMDPEQLADVFRIDIQHTNIGTAGEKGTGLGLILCKDLVEKNGGTIGVQSHPGQGTVFRFTLPRPYQTEQIEEQPL